MIEIFIRGILIQALRAAAKWPQPNRYEARRVLVSMPEDWFDPPGACLQLLHPKDN